MIKKTYQKIGKSAYFCYFAYGLIKERYSPGKIFPNKGKIPQQRKDIPQGKKYR